MAKILEIVKADELVLQHEEAQSEVLSHWGPALQEIFDAAGNRYLAPRFDPIATSTYLSHFDGNKATSFIIKPDGSMVSIAPAYDLLDSPHENRTAFEAIHADPGILEAIMAAVASPREHHVELTAYYETDELTSGGLSFKVRFENPWSSSKILDGESEPLMREWLTALSATAPEPVL